jgi:outer membrane protein
MTRRMNLVTLAATLLLSALALAPAASAQQLKIGVVDLQRALNETEDGRKAKAQLKGLFDKRQKTLDDQQNSLRTMKENLEKQKDVLSREVLAKKLDEYQKAFAELQTTYMDFQRELGAKEGELTKGILERMHRIMRRIGQADGYALVLDRAEAGVVYTPSSYDLTDVLIQRYNAGEGREDSAGAPSAKKSDKAAKK